MTNYSGENFLSTSNSTQGTFYSPTSNYYSSSSAQSINTATTKYFVMRGRDQDCVSITYRNWIVTGSPDTTGSQYTGSKCGSNPLTDIVVIEVYSK